MEIDITTIEETELKAMAFDTHHQIQILQNNYNIILQELDRRRRGQDEE